MARGIETHNGKVLLYDIGKQKIAVDLGKDRTLSTRINPLLVQVDESSNWYPDDHSSLIGADMYGAWILVQVGKKPSGSSTMLRLEENTKSDVILDSAFDVIASGDLSYLFKLHPGPGKSAWGLTGACTNEGGFIKIRVGNDDKYIQLWQTPP